MPSAFSQELATEKAKAAAGEAKVKKQLVAREQEITAVQARMQASYREHVKEVQQLQGKVGSGFRGTAGGQGRAGVVPRRQLTMSEEGWG